MEKSLIRRFGARIDESMKRRIDDITKGTAMSATYEPQIVAFCCKYCAYAAGDLAGSMRLNYPPNVKVIQVPCTGRVDILHLLRAIEDGADAVYVAG
jgi:F420-non-reducing hydrogenase iron-sulfur subunit